MARKLFSGLVSLVLAGLAPDGLDRFRGGFAAIREIRPQVRPIGEPDVAGGLVGALFWHGSIPIEIFFLK